MWGLQQDFLANLAPSCHAMQLCVLQENNLYLDMHCPLQSALTHKPAALAGSPDLVQRWCRHISRHLAGRSIVPSSALQATSGQGEGRPPVALADTAYLVHNLCHLEVVARQAWVARLRRMPLILFVNQREHMQSSWQLDEGSAHASRSFASA